jgi:hypothetical protein
MLTKKTPKTPKKYNCEKCHFNSSKKSEWSRHLITRKHESLTSLTEKDADFSIHLCSDCNKEYKSREGLWYHSKKCKGESNNKEDVKTLSHMVMELMKSNSELQKQLVDVCKNSNTNINSNNNNNNKTFNLHFFLNEQCKDAMNISEFVNTFELQLSDLESVGELGYVEGITKQIVNKLNSMDIYKRPMHCSDAKRETLYVKDEDKWEKEKTNNPKLRQAIKNISFNNMKLVGKWSDAYPESKSSESRLNDKYMKLVKQTTGGDGEIADSEDKIIRRIVKEIIIDKL